MTTQQQRCDNMGLIERVKAIPGGLKDTFNDSVENGVPGAILNGITRFGAKNAAARQSLGNDLGRRI